MEKDGKFIASGSTDQTVRRYLARFQDLRGAAIRPARIDA
jgi:hypothetical protein